MYDPSGMPRAICEEAHSYHCNKLKVIATDHCYTKSKSRSKNVGTGSKSARSVDSTTVSSLFDLQQYGGSFTIVNMNNTMRKFLAVPGDGNCFFHSLSLAKHDDFSMGTHYRNLNCTSLKNWETWGSFSTIVTWSVINLQPDIYWNHMLDKHGWATATEIQAACALLNINISVWLRGISYSEEECRYIARYTEQPYTTNMHFIP